MSVNIFVSDFLRQHDKDGTILRKWESVKNQRKLKKILKDKNKDPAKPKRGKSGFLFFCDENRPLIKQNHEDITVKEIVSKLGTLWRQLKTDGLTEKYDLLSTKDRERYKDEMVEYKKKKNTTTPKSRKTPKKKQTALDLYIKSKKTKVKIKHPDLTDGLIEKSLKDRWKKLPLAKRMKYIVANEEEDEEF
jgi:hypothetical protein